MYFLVDTLTGAVIKSGAQRAQLESALNNYKDYARRKVEQLESALKIAKANKTRCAYVPMVDRGHPVPMLEIYYHLKDARQARFELSQWEIIGDN
ncbi:MAG: hypothetical protein MJ237_08300 [bacterium]|nr:hypothetical protein [bacterium]